MLALLSPAIYAEPVYRFGVINQFSVHKTARFWNPIFEYVKNETGIRLVLSMNSTAALTTADTLQLKHDFVYSNHLFDPDRLKLGFEPILRTNRDAIRSAVILGEGSDTTSLDGLDGKVICFPTQEAFVGYKVPSAKFKNLQISYQALFAGNQEGAIRRFGMGDCHAAAVNKNILAKSRFVKESRPYRILWQSQAFQSIPIMASERVPMSDREEVAAALIGMGNTNKGREILRTSAQALNWSPQLRFVSTNATEYKSYVAFFARKEDVSR